MKKIISLFLVFCLAFGTIPLVLAEEKPNDFGPVSSSDTYAEGLYNTEIQPLATGLIQKGDLSIYLEANRTIRIVTKTTCTDFMDKVGFKDITLQRSDGSSWTNVSVWSTYRENDQTYLYDHRVTVEGGYYYRVTLKHYAEKGWWIFADTQEMYNETSALWVG